MENKEVQGIRVKSSPFFKLKNRVGKSFMAIKLKEGFGFYPETIIIERDTSRNNVIRVSAILTEEEIKKEDKRLKELLVKNKNDTTVKSDPKK